MNIIQVFKNFANKLRVPPEHELNNQPCAVPPLPIDQQRDVMEVQGLSPPPPGRGWKWRATCNSLPSIRLTL